MATTGNVVIVATNIDEIDAKELDLKQGSDDMAEWTPLSMRNADCARFARFPRAHRRGGNA